MLALDVKLRRGNFLLSAKLNTDNPITALFGPSGSGKSTLLKVIAGLAQPDKGWIKLGDETIFDSRKGVALSADTRRIGMVFQNRNSWADCPVKALFDTAIMKHVPHRLRRSRRNLIIDFLGVAHLMDRHFTFLSGGEKQRVGLAYSLMGSPRLLLLDEPLNAMDVECKSTIIPLLRQIKREFDLPIVYVSHALGEIVELTDQLAVMAQGRIICSGKIQDIVKDQKLSAIARLPAINNILPVTILAHDNEAGCTIGRYYGIDLVLPMHRRLELGSAVYMSIRSCDIALSTQYIAGISIQNQLKGRICAIIRTAENVLVQIDCGNTLLAGITLRALSDMGLQEGDIVYCLVKAHSFSYLSEFDAIHSPEESARQQTLDKAPASWQLGWAAH